jgi:hypothetical protein
MTILLNGYPGSYRAMTNTLSYFLRLQLDASLDVVKALGNLATQHQAWRFDDWGTAVTAAAQEVDSPVVFPDGDERQALLATVVVGATRIAQDLFDLTGQTQQGDIDRITNSILMDRGSLLNAALQVPADARRQVQAGQLAGYLNRGGSNRHIVAWAADPILMLVKHTQLVVAMPTVLPPGTNDQSPLGQSLLALTREERRIAATATLDVSIGGTQLTRTFIANSGAGQVEQRYQVPHPVLPNQTQGRIERTDAGSVYQAFAVAARPTDQATPRHLDADKKIFDLAHAVLVQRCQNADVGMHEVTGTFNFATGIRMCASCYLVGMQFLTNFPKITISTCRVTDQG